MRFEIRIALKFIIFIIINNAEIPQLKIRQIEGKKPQPEGRTCAQNNVQSSLNVFSQNVKFKQPLTPYRTVFYISIIVFDSSIHLHTYT